MRPRSQLLSKKHLPTICEAYEELFQDRIISSSAIVRPDPLSADDYLQSICQLATPTFPALQSHTRDTQSINKTNQVKHSQRLTRLPLLARPLTPIIHCHQDGSISPSEPHPGKVSHGIKASSHFHPDPLEQLYGQQEKLHLKEVEGKSRLSRRPQPRSEVGCCPVQEVGISAVQLNSHTARSEKSSHDGLPRTNSFPQLGSPRLVQRKSSCPEIGDHKDKLWNSEDVMAGTATSLLKLKIPNIKKGSTASGKSESTEDCPLAGADEDKVLFDWTPRCRNIWKATRFQTCMLPIIAEL
ncbi:uncharacterized protein si:dkeyp-72g9.4 [Polypterus senegalus]|uniref:uncharacterized protein si:dkeyp-72g9.4 n=1 Tax=Polypterus senegalus TaxID=55291 RepID=UPI00196424E1|nr:uncharacterized protein si:dkeyp-72g9.4 [Polypterus senegalus]XP_039631685.1 uncharacterized protein si:dkeyp-72g9.4 [Polypterus senegalus]